MKKRVIGLMALSVMLALGSGCGGGSGGGTRSITAGKTTTTANYGWSGAEDQLGFVIFTDLDAPGTVRLASANPSGILATSS